MTLAIQDTLCTANAANCGSSTEDSPDHQGALIAAGVLLAVLVIWSAWMTWEGWQLRKAYLRHSMAIHELAREQGKSLTVQVRQPLKTIRWTRDQMWAWRKKSGPR